MALDSEIPSQRAHLDRMDESEGGAVECPLYVLMIDSCACAVVLSS